MSNEIFIHKRKQYTQNQRREIRNRQFNYCAGCECSLFQGDPAAQKLRKDIEYDHILPLWLGGSNDLDNAQALCKSCHSKKTCAEGTLWAKNERLRKARLGGRGRKRRGRKLESRGFDKTLRKKMSGKVETNEPRDRSGDS